MAVHTFHLAKPGIFRVLSALWRPPSARTVAGLQHAECMMPMKLGAPVLSPLRWQLGRLAMFAAWENETAVDAFLASPGLGRVFADGWHVRLGFLRRWGQVEAFGDLPAKAATTDMEAPVVAVTVARMRMLQVPRFIRWGKPVERLVRDHPATTLALAATRPLGTVCTFSVWRTARDMTNMVHGRSDVPDPKRHAVADAERRRKDFHHEFTTLRFTCLGEYGEWEGRSAIVPAKPDQPDQSERPAAATAHV